MVIEKYLIANKIIKVNISREFSIFCIKNNVFHSIKHYK